MNRYNDDYEDDDEKRRIIIEEKIKTMEELVKKKEIAAQASTSYDQLERIKKMAGFLPPTTPMFPSMAPMPPGAGLSGYGSMGSIFNKPSSPNIVSFYKEGKNEEIVRLEKDGTVKWANGIEIDDAAKAFGKSLTLGAELQSGISQGVKLRMRDSVFEDLISIAKEKGPLSAEDLTYLLEASKIVERLKGHKD